MSPPPIHPKQEEMLIPKEEAADAVDALVVNDSPSIRFTWKIKNFTTLTKKNLYSDVFSIGECKWRVLIYPKGNKVDYLSMYLDVADSATLSSGWSRHARFKLAVVDQINSQFTVQKDSKHMFSGRESDWGFTSFMPLSDLYDPSKGYLLDDTCIVEADVALVAPALIFNDSSSIRLTWKIKNFSTLTEKKLYSDVFSIGEYKWRVLIYPKGNNVNHLSMYLDVADSATLPSGWSRYAKFKLAVVDQINSQFTVQKDTKHKFNRQESDWGFTSFMPLSELCDPGKGYLLNDTCIVEAEVVVGKVVDVVT